MRIGAGFGFLMLLTSGLYAQVRGGGSVVNPGGGTGLPGVTRSLGSVVNPGQGGLRVSGSRSGGNYGNRSVFAYPIYIGGYYATPYIGGPDDSGGAAQGPAPAQSNVTVVMPPQQPVTPVIINYNYGSAPPPPGQAQGPDQGGERNQAATEDDSASESSHYLIAFKDHTIYAATAYWVDGDTLHYFTAGNVHNQASLALVDRDFTERLNKEAGLEVKLPVPSK
jgi:hypothetical protein